MEVRAKAVQRRVAADGTALLTVYREVVLDDGTIVPGRHTFPEDTMEWRAAEYEIDPADQDTLLDIVLYEPFLEEPDNPGLLLHDAPDIAAARKYHLGRIERVKGKKVGLQSATPDPVLEEIKALSVIHPEAVTLKAEYVARGRAARAAQRVERVRAVEAQAAEVDRVERLRQAFSTRLPAPVMEDDNNG